jgi:hypothetical protein
VHAKQGGGGANGVRGGEGGGGGLRFCTPFCPSERDARRPARKRECAGSLAGTGRGPRGIPFPPGPLFARRPCLQTGEGWGTPRCAGAGIARGPRSCAAGTSHSYTREEKRVYNMRRARRTVRACPLLTPLPLLNLHATPPICRGGHKGGGALPCSCTRPNGNARGKQGGGRAYGGNAQEREVRADTASAPRFAPPPASRSTFSFKRWMGGTRANGVPQG